MNQVDDFVTKMNNLSSDNSSVKDLCEKYPIIPIILGGYASALKNNDRGALGKIVSAGNEIYQKWKLQKELGVKINLTNASGFDLTAEDDGEPTFNSKFRGGKNDAWYLEQTRRAGGKNKGKQASSGHICPKVNETVFYTITSPNGEYLNPEKWSLYIIPSVLAENKNNPGFVVPTINKKLKEKLKKLVIKDTYEQYRRK